MESADLISLQAYPIDVASAVAQTGDPQGGGIVIFLGTIRAETNTGGASLAALDYEAYGEMALAQMRHLAAKARQRWTIRKLVMIHRTGRVEVGQPSVLIAVSTPHRAAAFDACRFLIDSLKAEATIWKKEVWTDGRTSWVHPDKAAPRA